MDTTDSVRAAFVKLYRADEAKGSIRTLDAYRNLFPGFWDVVSPEFKRLQCESETTVEPAPEGRVSVRESLAAAPLPEEGRVGDYRLVRELGRGGMGIVHLAHDSRLNRHVALKVLSPVYASSPHLKARFEREASIASRLDHPGICTVFEAGEAGGVPFIAMRYVEGESLEHWIRMSREAVGLGARTIDCMMSVPDGEGDGGNGGDAPDKASTDERRTSSGAESREEIHRILHIVERTARALHSAHETGLIHRDIKPANIMLTRTGDPVVLDFGLARDEEGAGAALTQTGALMGTPAYMSPEQIAAHRIKLDRRTDVYSLGVTLYEALTLRLPYSAASRDSLYQKILVSHPENPLRHNPALPADVKVVLEKVLEKDRDRRYQTADEFAEDLRRVREMEPIHARPIGRVVRFQRWVQRNPGVALPTLGLALVVLGGPPVAMVVLDNVRESARKEGRAGGGALGELVENRNNAESPEVQIARQMLKDAILEEARNPQEARRQAQAILDLVSEDPTGDSVRRVAASLIAKIDGKGRR